MRIGVVGQPMSAWTYWNLPPLFNVVSAPPDDPYRWTVTVNSDTIFEVECSKMHFETSLVQQGIVDIQLISYAGLNYTRCTVAGTDQLNIDAVRCTVPLRGE